ncbi:MAG: FtsX-like permease family protein [Desulfobacterales bacterium]|jgi:putative ABC transport system permease protein|nr:FtsX-like permease family protein [Desulfobacterales bacterium]
MGRLTAFLRLFHQFSLRHLVRHRGRAVTVLLGIGLGAAVFTSVRLSVDASLSSFGRSVDLLAGRADRVVVEVTGAVPETLVAPLRRHPAVSAAAPVMTTYVRPAGDEARSFLLVGIDPILDRPMRTWTAEKRDGKTVTAWQRLMATPATLVAGASLARDLGWRVGDRVPLEHAMGRQDFEVAGILADEQLGRAEAGRLAIVDLATFQELTGRFGFVERIDLILRPDVSTGDLEALAALMPPGVSLQTPGGAKATGTAMVRAYQINLSVLSFASLFVGMFLVYSLVALNAASRRPELAILRSLGATPRRIFALFIGEGAVFGILGWALAIPVSTVLVKFLLDGVSRTISTLFVRVEIDRLALSPLEIGASFVLTVGVAVAAAWQPAREAMKVAPKEVLTQSPVTAEDGPGARRLALGGFGCILAALPLARIPGLPGLPLPGYLATLLLFVGFALLSPWGLRRLGGWFADGGDVPFVLAVRYVRDSGTRTAVSVGALITAVALFTALVIMVHSFRRTVEVWVTQTLSGDLFVAPKMAEAINFQDLMTDTDMQVVRSLETPATVVPHRRYNLEHQGVPYTLEAMPMIPFLRQGDFVWYQGPAEAIRPALREGKGVVVSEVFANRTGLTAGDRFEADLGRAVVKWPILGVIRDYRTQGGVVFADLDALLAVVPDAGWTGVRFYLPQDSAGVEHLRQELIARCGDRLDMVTGADLRQSILEVFDETFAVTTVLLLVALAVAALGITTTLTVLVLERTRQLNTLLAVGGSRRQIRRMIFTEAAFLVALGEAAGLVCGFLLSYLLIYVINRQSFGWTFIYRVDWAALGFSVPLIVATALAAAVPALRQVFRRPPATLLRER